MGRPGIRSSLRGRGYAADKWDYRPAAGLFKNKELKFDPTEVRTFAEQVKHVACSNFAFAAELDGNTPPEACYNGGPSPAHTPAELLVYLRDSFVALRNSLSAITAKNMYDPIEGPYAGPNTRVGLAAVCVWHAADHCRASWRVSFFLCPQILDLHAAVADDHVDDADPNEPTCFGPKHGAAVRQREVVHKPACGKCRIKAPPSGWRVGHYLEPWP